VTTVDKVVTVLDIGDDLISNVLCDLSLDFFLICIAEILECKTQWNRIILLLVTTFTILQHHRIIRMHRELTCANGIARTVNQSSWALGSSRRWIVCSVLIMHRQYIVHDGCHGHGPDMRDHGRGPAEEVTGKARTSEKTSNEGRVIFGEPGRQQLHHGFRDHELFVLGLQETLVTRIGFRETSQWSEGWEARHADG
jgi:hypothetical protein